MKLSLALLTLTATTASAFVHSSSRSSFSVPLASSAEGAVETVDVEPVAAAAPKPLGPTINGWTPDASLPCYGLPGAVEPLGFWDPLELSADKDLNEIKRLREAEIMHGRVASKYFRSANYSRNDTQSNHSPVQIHMLTFVMYTAAKSLLC